MTKKMPKKKRSGISPVLAASLSLLVVISPSVAAKKKPAQETPAIVSGSVFDDRGYSLPDATVTLAANALAGAKSKPLESISDARGEFVFHVPAGPTQYTVTASAKGYTSQQKSVMVQGEERVEVTFQLERQSK
ncbi:MAG TPA: carboxypeptidase-like regulatory domain-containing protein [Bryobacteraceae bacterium]|nr:carboxypeptidase-like regulatory domain-containing protein [Bryobacteraceae bacterium]